MNDHERVFPSPTQLTVLLPVYEDWEAVCALLPLLDRELEAHGLRAAIRIVDDGSMAPPPTPFFDRAPTSFTCVDVIVLRRNVGHQRAIAIGLSHLADQTVGTDVVVMDGDGEDKPSDVPRLVQAMRDECGNRVIFAQRTRRSEGVAFTMFYHLYRTVHLILTGIRVEIGNFSALPYRLLRRLVVSSELWNHYAASVVHGRLPTRLLPTSRGKRIVGQSRMNFVSLVSHGINAMAVFTDRIGARLFMFSSVVGVILGIAVLGMLGIRAFRIITIPSWFSVAVGVLSIVFVIAVLVAVGVIFINQRGRTTAPFIPARDYRIYLDYVRTIWRAGD